MVPHSPSLDDQRATWVIYCNLYILNLGGVPESGDMRAFAPQLWQEQTRTPAVYFVWNDASVGAGGGEAYIKQTKSLGRHKVVDERAEAPPDEVAGTVDDDVALELCERKAELWAAAEVKLAMRGRELFDTSGLSAHGIVPPRPEMVVDEDQVGV